MAGSLNIQTVAEWVENGEILERLHTLNIDLAQGFGIGRPAPIETLFGTTNCKEGRNDLSVNHAMRWR